MDRSHSMGNKDCEPECSDTKLESLKTAHNNRLGAVYEAVYKFIVKRNTFRNTKDSRISVNEDTNSLILFNDSATVVYENEDLSNPAALLTKMTQHKPEGCTNFSQGIKKASELIDKYHNPS